MIGPFRGEHAYLSNFYEGPEPVIVLGEEFPTAEHAYQADKADTWDGFHYIRKAPTPAKAKARGRRVSMRSGFEKEKLDTMHEVVWAKFTGDPNLRQKLIGTGDEKIVEYNDWGDRFWAKTSKTIRAQTPSAAS